MRFEVRAPVHLPSRVPAARIIGRTRAIPRKIPVSTYVVARSSAMAFVWRAAYERHVDKNDARNAARRLLVLAGLS